MALECPCWAHRGCEIRTWPPGNTVLAYGQVFPPNCSHYTGHLTPVMSFQGHTDHIVTCSRKEDMATQLRCTGQVWERGCYLLTSQSCQVYIRPLTSAGNPFIQRSLAGTATQITEPRSHRATEPWSHFSHVRASLAGYQSVLGLDSS